MSRKENQEVFQELVSHEFNAIQEDFFGDELVSPDKLIQLIAHAAACQELIAMLTADFFDNVSDYIKQQVTEGFKKGEGNSGFQTPADRL